MAIRIESTGIFDNAGDAVSESLEVISRAFERCLEKSAHTKAEIGLLMQISTYKDYNLGEPAFATFVQDDLEINHDKSNCAFPRTLSFDLLNGALGFLNACYAASAMIVSGQARTCLIVCGNVMVLKLNKESSPPGICSTGAAMLLDQAQHDDTGFNSFFFKSFPEHRTAYDSHLIFQEGKFSLVLQKDSNISQLYLSSISKTLSEFFEREQVSLDAFDLILPPQISPTFISDLAALLDVGPGKFVDVTKREGDMFTASLPATMDHVMGTKLAKPGQRALIINVGSGIQVGCASYTF